MSFSRLPIELMQMIVFFFLDHPKDVISLALCSKSVYGKLFGSVGDENEHDVDQHRAMTGVLHCLRMKWERASELALKRGFGDPTENNNMSFIFAARNGFSSVVGMLLKDKRCNPRIGWNAPLLACSDTGNRECVQLLLEDVRVNPMDGNYKSIQIALEKGHHDIAMDLFMDSRFDQTMFGNDHLKLVIQYGHVEIMRMLVSNENVRLRKSHVRFIQIECPKIMRLIITCERYDIQSLMLYLLISSARFLDVVEVLLSDKRVLHYCKSLWDQCLQVPKPSLEDLDFISSRFSARYAFSEKEFKLFNKNACYWAAKVGDLDVLTTLLGIEYFSFMFSKNMVLRIAAENGHDEIVSVMIHVYNANPCTHNSKALMLACKNGHVGVVRELLTYRPTTSFDIDQAMGLALRFGQKEILTLLVESVGVKLES